MKKEYYKKLVERYLSKQASEDEVRVFFQLLAEGALDAILEECMDHDGLLEAPYTIPYKRKRSYKKWMGIAATLTVGLFSLLFILGKNRTDRETVRIDISDIKPGQEKAELLLSDGTTISLERKNAILEFDGFTVETDQAGRVIYKFQEKGTSDPRKHFDERFNTIKTPVGGTFSVQLPDGSSIWLNSLSEVHFPLQFKKDIRQISVKGEVFLDVKKDRNRPFLVYAKGQTVKVLGTQFNINAYDDEPKIKTTLIEGSIELQYGNLKKRIQPGEEASISLNNSDIEIRTVDIDVAMAWKEGYFKFDRVDLKSLLRQIARWYDLEVKYEGDIAEGTFVGRIARTERIEDILEIFKKGNLNIVLEGRTLIVK